MFPPPPETFDRIVEKFRPGRRLAAAPGPRAAFTLTPVSRGKGTSFGPIGGCTTAGRLVTGAVDTTNTGDKQKQWGLGNARTVPRVPPS